MLINVKRGTEEKWKLCHVKTACGACLWALQCLIPKSVVCVFDA